MKYVTPLPEDLEPKTDSTTESTVASEWSRWRYPVLLVLSSFFLEVGFVLGREYTPSEQFRRPGTEDLLPLETCQCACSVPGDRPRLD